MLIICVLHEHQKPADAVGGPCICASLAVRACVCACVGVHDCPHMRSSVHSLDQEAAFTRGEGFRSESRRTTGGERESCPPPPNTRCSSEKNDKRWRTMKVERFARPAVPGTTAPRIEGPDPPPPSPHILQPSQPHLPTNTPRPAFAIAIDNITKQNLHPRDVACGKSGLPWFYLFPPLSPFPRHSLSPSPVKLLEPHA